MSTTVLTGTAPVFLPATAVTVVADGPGAGSLDIRVVPETVTCVRPRPGVVILPTVDTALQVLVVPRDRTEFPQDAAVHVVVSSGNGEDAERVILPGADVGGLPSIDLLRIEPIGSDIRLSLPAKIDAVRLSELGNAAHAVARAALGTARFGPEQRHDVDLVVDATVSMFAAAGSGRLEAATDLVLGGVAAVVGQSQRVTARLAGASVTPVDAEPHLLGQQLVSTTRSMPLTSGLTLPPRPPGPRVLRYVITDGLPLPTLDRADCVWVVLADASAAPVLAGSVPGRVVVVDGPASLFLQDRGALERAVRGLLAPVMESRRDLS